MVTEVEQPPRSLARWGWVLRELVLAWRFLPLSHLSSELVATVASGQQTLGPIFFLTFPPPPLTPSLKLEESGGSSFSTFRGRCSGKRHLSYSAPSSVELGPDRTQKACFQAS